MPSRNVVNHLGIPKRAASRTPRHPPAVPPAHPLLLRKFRRRVRPTVLKYLHTHPLTAVAIEINSACNRKCVWCPNHEAGRPQNKRLDEELVYDIIGQLAEMEFKGEVTFSLYNEPLLDKRLSKFIRYTRDRLPYSFIYLNTNGDLLDFQRWSSLRKAGLDYANISQYDGEINERVREICERLDYKEKMHFNAFVFGPSMINNRAGLVATDSTLPLKRFCCRPFYQLCVTYEGKVVICCNDYFGQVEVGDIRTKPIKELWEDEAFVCYRKELKQGNRANLELCRTCDA